MTPRYKPTMTRRLTLVAAAALVSLSALAQSWPTKTVTIISPYGPGGTNDVVARLFADRLSKALGQSFVVENKPGAAGMLGASLVAQATPDGYTLLSGNNCELIVQSVVKNPSLLFAPANCFPCIEGHIFIQIGNDMQWTRLCKSLGKDDWLQDPRYAKNAQRMVHKLELDGLLSGITRGWDKQALSDKLGAAGVPCGPVNTLEQAFAHPQVQHRGIRVPLEHPVYGTVDVIHSPLRFSKTPVEHRIPPALGADTADVLRQELHIDAAQFEQLRETGVV